MMKALILNLFLAWVLTSPSQCQPVEVIGHPVESPYRDLSLSIDFLLETLRKEGWEASGNATEIELTPNPDGTVTVSDPKAIHLFIEPVYEYVQFDECRNYYDGILYTTAEIHPTPPPPHFTLKKKPDLDIVTHQREWWKR